MYRNYEIHVACLVWTSKPPVHLPSSSSRVSQLGGLPVPWIQRLPVPVWVRWLQTLQRLLRLPAPDPVHASYQGHAVPPERMLHLHLRQQVNDPCWPSGAVIAMQHLTAFYFSKRPLSPIYNSFLNLHHHRSILKERQNKNVTLDNLKWLFMVLKKKINMLWKTWNLPGWITFIHTVEKSLMFE